MKNIKYIENSEWEGMLSSVSNIHPSFDPRWEQEISSTFPYVSFKHVLYKERWGIRLPMIKDRITSTPFSDGGDVFALEKGDKLSMEELKEDILQITPSFTLQVNEEMASVLGEDTTSLVDYRVPLKSDGEMLPSFRNTLRHVLEHDTNLSFSRVSTLSELQTVYRIYLKTMKSVLNLALPFSVFEYLYDFKDVYITKIDDLIVSFAVFIHTDDTSVAYYLSGATDKGKELDAPTHLLFHVMGEYHTKGFEYMYLGGTRKGTGLDTFKRGWRGEEISVHIISNEEEQSARRSPIRKLWSLVPTSATPALSKIVGKYLL